MSFGSLEIALGEFLDTTVIKPIVEEVDAVGTEVDASVARLIEKVDSLKATVDSLRLSVDELGERMDAITIISPAPTPVPAAEITQTNEEVEPEIQETLEQIISRVLATVTTHQLNSVQMQGWVNHFDNSGLFGAELEAEIARIGLVDAEKYNWPLV